MALTTDFSGTYDYEKTEAESEADYFLELAAEYTADEMSGKLAKLAEHWAKALPDTYDDFRKHFNAKWDNYMGINLA